MIITITGKPCSGKSVVIAYLIEKYGFEKFSGGEVFRRIATERGIDILELNRRQDTTIDKLVDEEIAKIGERDIEKNLIFDSRTAWHFIPKSFKVFLDINEDEQAKRLINSGRTNEIVNLSISEAKESLSERWRLENDRYMMLYNFDNRNMNEFNLVIDTSLFSVEQVAELIYSEYLKFVENR